jgi:hypothetical protein
MIGKIERVRLREVWPNEALNFTPWLKENIEVLGEATGLQLTSVEREQSAGDFSVDLVAESEAGLVVIENQLERSDHDHLGKVLTYLSQLSANSAIWVVSDPRPEHVTAISWLNDSSPASFYLVKVEAVRIGESSPAALFTLITGPSEEATRASETKRDMVGRERARLRFWSSLLEHARDHTSLHSGISPTKHNWIGSSAGLPSGFALNYVVRRHDTHVELYIDGGQESDGVNRSRFADLHNKMEEIETGFGGPLEWEPLDIRRACRISRRMELGGWMDEEQWDAVIETMVDSMIRMESAMRPHLNSI